MAVILIILAAIVSYLLGSISFAVIITRHTIKRDVRELGSGNAGMTNVMRSAGFAPGALTFALDFLKGVAAALVGKYFIFGFLADLAGVRFPMVYGLLICAIFCQWGHIFPLFFEFRGGKAVSCTAGLFTVVNWRALAVCAVVFALVFFITRIISASSVCALAALPFIEYFTVAPQYRLAAVLLSIVVTLNVIVKHKDNIVRIFKGEEKKLTVRRRSKHE